LTKSTNQKPLLKPNQFSDHLRGKKGEILLAAFQCIAEKGIAGTSTHAIASKAGLNQGSIHYYFESKAQLFKEVLEILFHNSTSNIEAVAASDLSPAKNWTTFWDLGIHLSGPEEMKSLSTLPSGPTQCPQEEECLSYIRSFLAAFAHR
jgi:AcrR family transcriptional regulator